MLPQEATSRVSVPDALGHITVPPGKVAAVVTWLEMRTRPEPLAHVARRGDLAVRPVPQPDLDWYRRFFTAIGERWLWFSRLEMDDTALRGIVHDPAVDVFVLTRQGQEIGMLELDRRASSDIELSFLGLTPDAIGVGAGRFLLDFAIAEAWSHTPARFWLHTCTLDHPRALAFYMKAGFRPYGVSVEIADDPRKTGILPPYAAPHVPVT